MLGTQDTPRDVPGRICPIFVRVRTLLTAPTPPQGFPASTSGPARCRVSPKAVFNHSMYFWKLSGILCPAEPCVLFPTNCFSISSSHLLALPAYATCISWGFLVLQINMGKQRELPPPLNHEPPKRTPSPVCCGQAHK